MNTNMPSYPGWETVKKIGTGSFGAVYEIERELFGKKEQAALKLISIPQSESDIEELYSNGYDDESITAHFNDCLADIVREYTLMVDMKGHTNVVYCDDIRYVQKDDGFGWNIYIKMELLTSLTRALGNGFSEEQVIKIGADICSALVICKSRNIIHRDIKPQNIFVSKDGDYKLGDFGIAKTVEKTSGGTKIGTYNYMAPEVYNNLPYGHTADIYSLGLVLYWLMNERRMPFNPLPPVVPKSSDMDNARFRRFSGEPLPTPAHGGEELKRIVLKACAYDPKDRYQSAADMLSDLEKLGAPKHERAEPMIIPMPELLAELGRDERDDETVLLCSEVSDFDDETVLLYNDASKSDDETMGVFSKKKDAPQVDEDKTMGVWTQSAPEKKSASPDDRSVRFCAELEQGKADKGLGKNGRQKKWKILAILVIGILLIGIAVGIMLLMGNKSKPEDKPEFRLIRETETYLDGGEDVTEYVYDKNGNRTEGNTYRNGEQISKYVYTCDENGKILSYDFYFPIDKYSSTVVFEYDQNGRTTKEITFSDGKPSMQNEFGYDRNGHQNKWDTTYFDENGNVRYISSQLYDRYVGKQVLRIMPDGTSNVLLNVEQVFDERERLVQDSKYFADDGELFWETTYKYDEYGNIIEKNSWQKARGMEASSCSTVYEYVQIGVETGYSLATAGGEYGYSDLGWNNIVDIAKGNWHMLGLKTDGTVVAASRDISGEKACDVSEWSEIKAIAAGNGFSLGLKEDGTVVSVGDYSDGYIIDTSDWTGIKAIYAEEGQAVGLKSDGTAVATGWNDYNQCEVEGWNNIKKIALGSDYTAALKNDGTVVSTDKKYDVSTWTDMVDIEAGYSFIAGLRADGTVLIASYDEWGAVDTSSWTDIVKISAGCYGIVGLKADGTVVEDGISTETGGSSSAYDTSSWCDIVDIAASGFVTVGLKSDGEVVISQDREYSTQFAVSDWQGIKKVYSGFGGPVGLY